MIALLFIAWTGLGHRVVAENAALLMDGDAAPLLQRHRMELGVYATLPDGVFRRHDKNEGTLHYLDLDKRPLAEWMKGPASPEDGRVPWRVEQLARLARAQWAQVKKVEGGWQTGNDATGDTAHVFKAFFYMGLLAHYTGDSAVPHHATSDRNGFAKGQGGVHFFFEGNCVAAFEPSLAPDALKLARQKRAEWLAQWKTLGDSEVALTLAVLDDSAKRVPSVEAADKPFITKPSADAALATRKPEATACGAQRQIIVERLAKGAVLTAELWQRVIPTGIDWSASKQLQLTDMMDGVSSVPFP